MRRARQIVLALSFSIIIPLSWGVLKAHSAPVYVPSGIPVEVGSQVSAGVPDTVLTLTGCASPNAFVTVYDDNNPVGTVIANSNGRFTKQVVAQEHGLHNIKVYFDDVNNRTSSLISQNISLAAHATTNLDLLLPTTIEHEPEPVKVGDYLIFRGTGCPFSLVNVIINNNYTLAAQADNRGNWYVIADTEGYYVGAHVYEAITSLNNKTSPKTQKYQFNTAGENSSDSDLPQLTVPVITSPKDKYLSSTRNVTANGTGPTNSQIEIYIDDTLRGSVFTNPIGEWSFNLTMFSAQHSIKVRSCYKDSCSQFSESVRIYFGGELNRCMLNFYLSNYRFYGFEKDDGIDLKIDRLTGTPSYEALIDWGDSTIEHMTLINDNPLKMHHVYKQNGQFNGVITIQDSMGCNHSQYFSVYVGSKDQPNWFLLLIIPGTGLLAYFIANSISLYRTKTQDYPSGYMPKLKPSFGFKPKPALGKEKPTKPVDKPDKPSD